MVCDNLDTTQKGSCICKYQVELNTYGKTSLKCPKQYLRGAISPNCWRKQKVEIQEMLSLSHNSGNEKCAAEIARTRKEKAK